MFKYEYKMVEDDNIDDFSKKVTDLANLHHKEVDEMCKQGYDHDCSGEHFFKPVSSVSVSGGIYSVIMGRCV